MAATTRAAFGSNATAAASSRILLKTPFDLKRGINALSFNDGRRLSERLFYCNAIYNPQVQIKREGQPETLDYRVFFENTSGKKISLCMTFHSNWEMVFLTSLLRYPKNQAQKWRLLLMSYTLPLSRIQRRESFDITLDFVEIGDARGKIGEILKVKPLAALAMIDEGELDWKIVTMASLVNDVDDVEKHFPGTLIAIRNWFRDYKIPDEKPANKFGLGNEEYALKVITETNESWAKLVKRSIPAGELFARITTTRNIRGYAFKFQLHKK